MPTISHRGKPASDSPIHKHRKQYRPGLREGFNPQNCDYLIDVECLNGSFHVRIAYEWQDVTCEECLKSKP